LKRRALFVTRYPEQLPVNLDERIRHEAYVPFSSVFPHCAAVVHHGGIGTCAQALAAGVPQLTMPLAFDQPDNATRLWRLGVARWVRPHQFRGERVATELAALIDDAGVADRCRYWASDVHKTDAMADTCSLLESLIPRTHTTSTV
jgi:rhamnosyltransferase subunit B